MAKEIEKHAEIKLEITKCLKGLTVHEADDLLEDLRFDLIEKAQKEFTI